MPQQSATVRLGLVALTSLFFAWGFITCLNDILVPHLRAVFDLSYSQAALVQSAFFLAYFVSSLPAAGVVARFGYKKGLSIGLVLMAIGAVAFVPAATSLSYPMFLAALFILASGITLLQVTANPYVTLLGKPEGGSARLNLTQAFNALGTTVAPLAGGALILSSDVAGASSVIQPYLMIAAVLLALAVIFYFLPMPEPAEQPAKVSVAAVKQTLGFSNLSLGVLAIFVYVGAEVAIGTFIVDYVKSTMNISSGTDAAGYVTFYWGGAMVGRFIGSWLMRYIPAARLLMGAGLGAATLVVASFLLQGELAVYVLLAVGLCNSIMFPTIFSLGLRNLGPLTGVGSSLMAMAISGGAVIPLIVGTLADAMGLKFALVLPAACYLYVAYFGFFNRQVR